MLFMRTEDVLLFGENLIARLTAILPSVITSLIILLLGYFLGRLFQRLIKRLILHINEKMKARLQGSILNLNLRSSAVFISATFFWIIISIAVLIAIQILEFNILNDLLERAMLYLPNIVAAILIVYAGLIFGRLLSNLLQSATTQSGIANKSFISIAVRYFIILIAVIIASDQLGIHIDFLTDVIDIILAMLLFGAALAFGLGAKASVSNIFGSYYARKDHQIGTRIRYTDITGTIVKISGHSIHLETDEGKIIIPAKNFSEKEVTIIQEEDD